MPSPPPSPFAEHAPEHAADVGLPRLSLEATAFTRAQLIRPEAPQVALAGRSNVGKSSLINALAGQKNLARVSAAPGKTRSINYYSAAGSPGYLVDLPGYGYAKCSQAERKTWAALLDYYFRNTPGLRGLLLLLDARLPPQKSDTDLLAFAFSLALPVTPVLTKTDKCKKRELAATANAWEALVGKGTLRYTSATGKTGILELWQAIAAMLGQAG